MSNSQILIALQKMRDEQKTVAHPNQGNAPGGSRASRPWTI
ncbi:MULTISPECIES: hypothetical protein [Actinomadura]|uniref:Uncharacterized protein n=1 Tax=Actinomadura yumaensis TaxID=111807 RepID=A0ABW2CH20_9ACTN|nr:hypothetical protein [Actinomadura sp. J1-007]